MRAAGDAPGGFDDMRRRARSHVRSAERVRSAVALSRVPSCTQRLTQITDLEIPTYFLTCQVAWGDMITHVYDMLYVA